MTEVNPQRQRKKRVLAGLLLLFFLVSLLLALPLPEEGPVSPTALAEIDPVANGSPSVQAVTETAATAGPGEELATAESSTGEAESDNEKLTVTPQADQKITSTPRATATPIPAQPASPTPARNPVVAKETTSGEDNATEFEPETGEETGPTHQPTATLENELPVSATSTISAVTGLAEETAEATSYTSTPSPPAAGVEEGTTSPAIGSTPASVGSTATQPAETLTPVPIISPEPLEAGPGATPAATETRSPVVDSGPYYINENMAGEAVPSQEDETVADRPTVDPAEAATPDQVSEAPEADLASEAEEVPPPNGLPTTGVKVKESYSLYGFIWSIIILLLSAGLAKVLNREFFGL